MATPSFVTSNIPANTDGSSLTQAQKNAFLQQQPAMLGQKHQTTIKNIKDLQEIEKYMFNNLQTLNKSSSASGQQTEIIKKRISELSAMRMALFGQLKTMYKDTQQLTADNRSNLTDQITMTKVVENELDNAKAQLKVLEQEKLNKKRLVELGEYEYDRYTSFKNLLKVIAYGALGVLIIVIAMGQPWFPAMLGVGAIVLIMTVVLITIVRRILTNWRRDELNWNKFRFKKGCLRTDAKGNCLTSSKERKAFDWLKLFSDQCENIAAAGKAAVKGALKIQTGGQFKLTPGAGGENPDNTPGEGTDAAAAKIAASSDGFTNMVNPSQPKGFESFYSIF